MPKTKIKTKPLINLKVGVLLATSFLLATTALWTAELYFSSIILTGENLPTTSLSSLGIPLIDFPLLESTGTSVRSRGSIANLSASFAGNQIFWQKTPTPIQVPSEDPNFLQSFDGLIAYWKLNNNLIDSSGNNITALSKLASSFGSMTIGNLCASRPGLIKQGCTFGIFAGQYLDISTISNLINPQAGTISVWIHPTKLVNGYVIYGLGANNDVYQIEVGNESFRIIRGSSQSQIERSGIEINKWHYLTMTWDNEKVSAYLNGELVGSMGYQSPFSPSPNFYLGNCRSCPANKPFFGHVDEISFFNRKLSNEEILQIYTDTKNAHDSVVTITVDNKKYLYLNNTNHDAYGQLRINTHTQVQQLNLPSKITISGEIYLTEYPKDYELFTIYSDTTVLGQGNTLAINSQGQAVLNANTGNTRYLYTAENSPVPLNQWIQISGSFNSETNEMLIQVNNSEFGTDIPQKTENIKRTFTTRPIIGNTNYWRNGLRGYIRNVKVWNKSLLNGQYSINKFVTPIKNGFNYKLASDPKAFWLGSGSLEIIHTNIYPEVTFKPGPEGNQEMSSRVSKEYLMNIRHNSQIINKKTVAWTAWVNKESLINMVINTPLEETERQAIEAYQTVADWTGWDIENDWYVENKNYIGPNRFSDGWLLNSDFQMSHLLLGKVKNPNNPQTDFEEIIQILKDIKIIDNIQYR